MNTIVATVYLYKQPHIVLYELRTLSLSLYLGFTARQYYFTHFEPSQSQGGTKTGDPREKPPDHPQAELGLSHMWPELGSNSQRWDDERFRALKISVLNHSATGVAAVTSQHGALLSDDIKALKTNR